MGGQSIQGLWGPLVWSGVAALFRLVSSFALRDAQVGEHERKIPDDESPGGYPGVPGQQPLCETMTAPGPPGDPTIKLEDFPASFKGPGSMGLSD